MRHPSFSRRHATPKPSKRESRTQKKPPRAVAGQLPLAESRKSVMQCAGFIGGKLLLKGGKGGEAPPGKRAAPQAGERAFPFRNPARFPAADKACFSCAAGGGRIGRSSDRPIRKRRFYLIAMILTFISPPGVCTTTSSPTLLPSRLLAIGESLDIFPSKGSASALPTIV